MARIAKNQSSPLEQHMKECPSRNQSVTVSQTSTTKSTVVPIVASRSADLEEKGSVGEDGVPIQTQQQPFIGCLSRNSAQGSGSPRLDQDDLHFLQSLDEECITKSIIL